MIDRKALVYNAVQQFGKPYQFGSKWPVNNPNPQGPVDCSGFTKWAWGQMGIDIPDGSSMQYEFSTAISPSILILPGDLIFLKTDLGPEDTHHVAMVYDQYLTIEARGIISNGKEIGSVQFRTRKELELRPDFDGYRRPKSVLAKEGV